MLVDDYDQLYHLLRHASNTCNVDELSTLQGLVSHLFTGGDYLGLARFLAFYGRKYLADGVYSEMVDAGITPTRIVEFGAGLGWLSNSLASCFKIDKTLTIDKRAWIGTDMIADMETRRGLEAVHRQLTEGDVIVMSEFIHCVNNPKEITSLFREWPMVILEYCPSSGAYVESYRKQITRYGATYMGPDTLAEMFRNVPGKVIRCIRNHIVIVTNPIKNMEV